MTSDKTMFYELEKVLTTDKKVIATLGNELSQKEVIKEIKALSNSLIDLGVKEGDSVAINLPNFAEAIIAFYAINRIGAVANIIHPLLPTNALIDLVKKTSAKYLFTPDIFLKDKLQALLDNNISPIVCSVSHYAKGLRKTVMNIALRGKRKTLKAHNLIYYSELVKAGYDKNYEINNSMTEKSDAIILHSGGTTGEPKSIVLSNGAMNNLSDSLTEIVAADRNESHVMLMVLPLFHGFGLGVCMHTVLTKGYSIVMMESFNAKKAIELIKKYNVSAIAGVPTMYDKLLHQKTFEGEHLKNLKYLFCGGDKLPYALKTKFDDVLQKWGSKAELQEGYGLTEVVTVCTVNRKGESEVGSVGSPLKGIKLKICDFNSGEELAPMQIGEICVSGITTMNRYYQDEETTAKTLRKDSNGEIWVHTGDCGYLNEKGKLFFKERLKRLVKISGVNVFPAEIEMLVSSHEAVKYAAIKEYKVDGKSNLELFIVLNDGYVYNQDLEDSILRLCKEKLIRYSIPRKITVKDSLPLTAIGKVDIKAL